MRHRVSPPFIQIILAVLVLLVSGGVGAQSSDPADSCLALVQTALHAADEACLGTARNQICYGNVLNRATPVDGVTDFQFETTGDIEQLLRLASLELSALDEARSEWGVAIMQVQASLPDTLPGQNVMFLLFGNTTIRSNTGPQARIAASALQAANVRIGPNTTSAVVGSLQRGSEVVATGKYVNASGELWLRVFFENYRTRTGWILGDLIDVDVDALEDVGARSQTYNPMQAFYFQTGVGRPTCSAVPNGGILVQTPRGVGTVTFNLNGIDVGLGSTAYFASSGPEERTCMSLLEGGADVRSGGSGTDVRPGERSCAAGPNQPPVVEPFDADEMARLLPFLALLPEAVTIPPPAPKRAPTPTQVVVTDVQSQVTPETPSQSPPAATPSGTTRFVTGSYSRSYFTANFSASAGPDAPTIIRWNFGDGGTASGGTVNHAYASGGTYTTRVEACWSDGFCAQNNLDVAIPPCAIDFSVSGSIQFNFTGSSEVFQIGKKDEACNPIVLNVLDTGNPTFGSGTFRGEHWFAIDTASSVTVVDVIVPDANPLLFNLP